MAHSRTLVDTMFVLYREGESSPIELNILALSRRELPLSRQNICHAQTARYIRNNQQMQLMQSVQSQCAWGTVRRSHAASKDL